MAKNDTLAKLHKLDDQLLKELEEILVGRLPPGGNANIERGVYIIAAVRKRLTEEN